MSRIRFAAQHPALGLLVALAVTAVLVDLVMGWGSAVGSVLILAVCAWIVEGRYRDMLDSQMRENEANARWSLSGLMLTGERWPSLGGWALGPAAVAEWVRRIAALEQPTVVELGPGSSTFMLARAFPVIEIHAVEHDPRYADQIRAMAARADMQGVKVIDAPLAAQRSGNDWYDGHALNALPAHIDALLIDGPPNWDGKGRRCPARAVIEERMSAGGLVLVDDTHRPDERSMVRSWVKSGLCRILQDAGSHVFLEKC